MTLYWRRQIGQHPIYAAQGAFRLTGEGRKPVRASFRQNVPKGKYDVRVRRISPDSTNDRWTLETALAGIKFYQEQPSNTKGQTRVGMTLKASGQLNGSIDRYSAMTVAACPMPGVSYWLGGDPVQNIVEVQTSNPAAWFYKIASGFYDVDNRLLAGLGLPDAEIDIEGLKQWAQFCSLNNLNFNGAFTSKVSAGEALNKIARIGRASISFQSGKLGVIWDSPGQAPVAMFGPHNMLPGTFSISYPSEQTADEIVVRFENEENNYESDTVRVQVPGSLTVGQNPAEIDLFGCTNKVQAAKEANLLAAAQVWRRRRIHWETDLEGLIVTRGDVVLLSHDLTSWGATGRVFSATSATSITLDKPVTGTGTQQWLAFRAPDQLLITYHRVLSFTGEQQTITLLDPLPLVPGADGDHVAADYVWAFDATSTPGKKAKIISIVPTDENRVQITAVDENDEYYLSEDNPYQYAPSVPIVGVIPTITNLKVVVENDPESQAEQIYAYVSWDIIGPNFSEAHIYVRENNGAWTFKGISKQSNFSFPVNPSSTYEIRVTVFGSQGVLGGGNSATIVWSPFDTAPPPVEDLESETGSTITAGQDMRIKWSPSPLTSFYEVTIKAGAFERSVRVEETRFVYTAEDARLDGGPWRSITFEVRAGNAYGLSDPASITLTNPAPAALQGISLQSSFDIAILSFLRPTDADYVGVLVWMDPDPGFTPSSANLVFEGSDNVITLRLPNPSITYYVKAAAYDTFGKDELNISAALSVKASMIEHADLADDFAELLENLELQNTVKLKNGAIAGIGLATSSPDADEDTSAFIIQANKFGMVLPDTGEVAITTIARSSNTVTATTSAPHGLETGFGVLVSGVTNSSFNGEFIITEVPSTTQLKWVQSASNASSSGGKLRVKPVIPFIFDTDGDVPILSVQGHISADRIRAGTFQAVTGVGSTRVLIDGENERISVNDGTRDRVKLGKLGTGQYGLELIDAAGNVILSNDGRLGSTLYIGQGTTTLGDVLDNVGTPPIRFVGTFASHPSPVGYEENSTYRNSTDGNTYILTSGAWVLFLEKGEDGDKGDKGDPGTPGSPGSPGPRGTVNLSAFRSTSSWNNAAANTAISNAGYGTPVNGDIVTLYNSTWSDSRFYSSGSWLSITAYLNGNLFIDGTIYGRSIVARTIEGGHLKVGAITAASSVIDVSAIGTLQVAGNAVTTMNQNNGGNVALVANSNVGAVQVGVNMGAALLGSGVVVMGMCSLHVTTDANMSIHIQRMRDGAPLGVAGKTCRGGTTDQMLVFAYDPAPVTGVNNYQVVVWTPAGKSGYIEASGIVATGGKR